MIARTIPLALAIAAAANAQDPVAAWSFNGRFRGMARDVAANRHHASARAKTEYVAAPGGDAFLFDGRSSSVIVPSHPDLVAGETLTLDVWVWVDDVDAPEPQCLVDKGGERYRLQVSPGGAAMFGLKNDDARMDLTGGKLGSERWHRITGVYDAPIARLYVDAELVAETTWDEPIGAGGDLFIGSKGGVTYFLGGQIDEVRIYREARAPQADDGPTDAVPGMRGVEAKMDVTQDANGVTIDTGPARFRLSASGAIESVATGDAEVVSGNATALLSGSLLESASYDGWRDHTDGAIVDGTPELGDMSVEEDADECGVTWSAGLAFGEGDAIAGQVTARLRAGSPFLSLAVELAPEGAFENRFLRTLALRVPMSLNKRKRIVQGGDRGVRWDTRHWYQFTVGTTGKLLEEPDHNIWRRFAIDQQSPHDYHIWRSESEATSPLSMQRGEAAPGWMAAFDERVGMLIAYRDMPARAPKALWFEADDSGEAIVYLHSPTVPALAISSPQAEAVFGAPHVTDWMPFAGEFRFTQPDLELARHWGVEALASDPPPVPNMPAGGENPLSPESAPELAPHVSGGVPFERGVLTDPGNACLTVDETPVPLQTRPMGFWPDGSIKWLLLTFPLDGGAVTDAVKGPESFAFEATLRDGSRRSLTLTYGGDARPGAPEGALTATLDAGTITIDTGPLKLELGTGPNWLRSAALEGQALLAAGGGSYVDFLRPETVPPSGLAHTQAVLDAGRLNADDIQLEEAGPLRAVARIEGMTDSEEPQRVIIRLEAYSGRSAVRMYQSVEFLHKDPRTAFVRRMGLELPLDIEEEASVTAGGQDGPVGLDAAPRAGLRQHSHLGYVAWRKDTGGSFMRTVESNGRSRGWIDAAGAAGGVAIALRDMWQQAPNELHFDAESGALTADFWPESMPAMDVRRYSNYPHQSLGEWVRPACNWVADTYYPNDPFVGVSKTHELLIYFHGDETDPEVIDALAGDFHRPPLVWTGADRYRETAVSPGYTSPDAGRFARMDANLEHFAEFWMHHQKLWGWYGLWDYGDVGHYFHGGYGSIVSPDALREALAEGDGPNVSAARIQDYRPNHDWAFDNGRWGWANTEGLLNLLLQTQYLRTGDRDLYFFVEAMARHNRDVDMRHAGKWFGYGTRHGVQHWSDGNHEERQTTHSEFRVHHALSGDMRSRDFARELYEGIYRERDVTNHATHSGRLQGLLAQWEMTGSDEVAEILAKYVPMFRVPEGLCESPYVEFPGPVLRTAEREINSGNMFFWSFGAAHCVVEYYELTGEPAIREALIATADDAIARGDIGLRRRAVVFAARHADDPEPYLAAIRDWANGSGSAALLQMVAHNRDHYAGPRSFLRGSTAGALFTMNDVPYLMTVLGADPPIGAEIARTDAEGGAYYGEPTLSWQSEFDLPEFAEYFRIKHPQP